MPRCTDSGASETPRSRRRRELGRGFVEIEEEKSCFSDGSCGAFYRRRDSSSFSAKEGEKETHAHTHTCTHKSEMAHGSSSVETSSLRREVTAGDYVSCVNSPAREQRSLSRCESRARFRNELADIRVAIADRSARNEKINWPLARIPHVKIQWPPRLPRQMNR